MPAKNTAQNLPRATVVELTDTSASAITLMNTGDFDVMLCATAAADPAPAYDSEGPWLRLRPGLALNDTLANIWRGVTTPERIYAYAPAGGQVFVSHG